MENPRGYSFVLCLMIFYLGGIDHASCKRDEFLSGWVIVGPLNIMRAPVLIDQSVDLGHCVIEWKTPEIGTERKDPVVASV